LIAEQGRAGGGRQFLTTVWGGALSEDFPGLVGFRVGSLLAGYRLEAQVGAGGFAVVFRARDERLGRVVALKILAPALTSDPEFRRRFIAESRAAAVVDDPHIVPVHEAGEAGGVLFIAMRFVQGGDLRRVLAREGALAPDRAAGFISPVASALDAAHRAGLVHRDVKPANILVDASPGRPDHVYLSDFGVSKGATASVSLTGAGQFLGTPDYSAPEQIQGRAVDGRADQYALACVAYQLLTGAAPFERDQGMAVLLAHLSEPPPSLSARRPGLPAAADEVLARGMAKVPEKRYASCRDFADALREALGLAPYYLPGTAATADHPQTQTVSPPTGWPGPAGASPATDTVPPITGTAPSPAYPAAGQAGARPDAGPGRPPGDGEQHTAPARHDDHHGAVTVVPGPGEKTPRAPRPGRAIRRRSVIITAAAGIVVIGLVIAITTLPGATRSSAGPGSSSTPHVSASSPGANSPGTLRWSRTIGGPIDSSPVVAGGTVYFVNNDGTVYALDPATGQVRWTYPTGGTFDYTNPVVSGGTLYVGSSSGKEYALDAATGQVRWSYPAGNIDSSPAVTGGTVYIGWNTASTGGVYALDAATGRVRWSYLIYSFIVFSRPSVAGGIVYFADDDGKVYALDAATGQVRWTYPTGGVVMSSPAVAGGTVYVANDNGKVYALDAATGQVRWTYTVGGAFDYATPAVAGGTVYVGSTSGQVYALDAATGQVRWSHPISFGLAVSSPAVAGGTVYVGSKDGKVYALNAATGQVRWTYTTGGHVYSSPAVAGGTVYVGSDDGKLYALAAGS
jgi:eukaryotic-like serine/threonine-protein kinase